MDDVTANAQNLARHERILARARAEKLVEDQSVDAGAFPDALTTALAKPAPAAAPAEMTLAEPARTAPSAPAAPSSAPMPTLTNDQMDQLAAAFAPEAAAPQVADAPTSPNVAPPTGNLSADQAALLMQSFGMQTAAGPARDEVTAIPRAKAVAEATTVDPMSQLTANINSLAPDQQALLMKSFGVTGGSSLPEPAPIPMKTASANALEDNPDYAGKRDYTGAPEAESYVAPTAADGAALSVPTGAMTEQRFFPITPQNAPTIAPASASDAYLRTVRTVSGRLGGYQAGLGGGS